MCRRDLTKLFTVLLDSLSYGIYKKRERGEVTTYLKADKPVYSDNALLHFLLILL